MTYDEALSDLLANLPSKYNKTEGSVIRDLLSPVALQLTDVYNTLDSISDNAFALTAEGDWLDKKCFEQGLTRKTGTYAKGKIIIYGTTNVQIPKGTMMKTTDNVIFLTTRKAIISSIGSVIVPVSAYNIGANGNKGAGTVMTLLISKTGITKLHVPSGGEITGGTDTETDAELRQRYYKKVSEPAVSGNKTNYENWAIEGGADAVTVYPLWNGDDPEKAEEESYAGYVTVVITNADGTPCTSKVATVQSYIDNLAPIGANVVVRTTEELQLTLHIVNLKEDTDRTDEIKEAVAYYLSNVQSSGGTVYIKKVESAILGIRGVSDLGSIYFKSGETTYNANFSLTSIQSPSLSDVVLETSEASV